MLPSNSESNHSKHGRLGESGVVRGQRISTLQLAVVLSVFLALAIPSIAGIVFEHLQAETRARAELDRDISRSTDVLAASLSTPLWEFASVPAEAIVQAMIQDSRFVSIVVTEVGSGGTFVQVARSAGGKEASISLDQPIVREGRVIGTVRVTMTMAPYLEAARGQSLRNFALLAAVLVCALLAIVWVLRSRLIRPIEELTAEANRLADGSLAEPIKGGNGTELGRVATAMEVMRCRLLDTFGELQDKNRQLSEHAEMLESRVHQRTLELQQTLDSLKATQNSLVESEKLASLGRLVAGVAHELNTPIGNALTVITTADQLDASFAEMLNSGSIQRSKLNDFLQRTKDGHAIAGRNIVRAAEIIRSFKQLAIDQTTDMRRDFDLKEVIEEVLTSIQPSFRRSPIRIETDLVPGLQMDSFPGPLGQVLTNIALNALIHAFEGREIGCLRITTEQRSPGSVRIVCRDDGVGMDEATRHRIFDPFFTTKLGAGGTGLGLHISYTFVTGLLGGSIDVASTPGTGTEFVILLPLVAPVREHDGER